MENKSAAEALKAELGFATAPVSTPTNTQPISAKAALKRKIEVMEENNEDSETDYSAPATPIPKPKATNGIVEDVEDTVKYTYAFQTLANFRLWEPGHKERYYEQKFNVDYHEDIEFRQKYTSTHSMLTVASSNPTLRDSVGSSYTTTKAVPPGHGTTRITLPPSLPTSKISPPSTSNSNRALPSNPLNNSWESSPPHPVTSSPRPSDHSWWRRIHPS